MGFFAQVEQAGQRMWSNVDAVLRAPVSALAWEAALTGVESNPDFFPAGFFREPFRGADWDITGPGIGSALAPIDELDLEASGVLSVAADAYGVGLAKVTSDTDVVNVRGNEWTRLSDGGVDYRSVNESSYCTAENGDCSCPERFTPLLEGLQPLQPEFAVAMTGTTEPAQIFLIGLSLEQFCEPVATDPPASPKSDYRDCDQIITEGELEAALGQPLELIEKSGTPPDGIEPAPGLKWTACTYQLPSLHRVALEFGYYPDAATVRSEYEVMRAQAEFVPVDLAGIGDAAFVSPPAPIAFIVAVKGTWFFLMSGLTEDLGGSTALVEDLARRAFGRVE